MHTKHSSKFADRESLWATHARTAGRCMRGVSTRWIIIALTIGLLLAGSVGVVLLRTTGFGLGVLGGAGNRLDDWIGTQIVGIANSYLVPQIAFDDLVYRAPGTVVLTGVRLTAPEGTRILEMDSMTVTLAQVPRIGEPIVIERIALGSPTLRLISKQLPDGSKGFAGLSPIVKGGQGQGAEPEKVDENFQLSRVLQLREIVIANGSFFYDARDGSRPMTIAGLTTTINASKRSSQAGLYDLDVTSALGPLSQLTLSGAINLDTFVLDLDELGFDGTLSEQVIDALPSQLQTPIREHKLRGQAHLEASGRVDLLDPKAGQLELKTTLVDGFVTAQTYQLPIDEAVLEATMADGLVTLTGLHVRMLKGTVSMHGDIELLKSGSPAHVSWDMQDLSLADLLAAENAEADAENDQPKENEQSDEKNGASGPTLAGLLSSSGSASTQLTSPQELLTGTGELHIRDGQLLLVPGLAQLADLMHIATANLLRSSLNHTLDAQFDLTPTGVEITESELTTGSLAARATGTIGFDSTLDLAVNAGPLEKLQSLLGKAGDLIGSITDRLVKYRIRGTLQNPEVSVDPLGLRG